MAPVLIRPHDSLEENDDGLALDGTVDRDLQLQHVLPLLVHGAGVDDHGPRLVRERHRLPHPRRVTATASPWAGGRSSSPSTSRGRPCSMATPPPASTSTTAPTPTSAGSWRRSAADRRAARWRRSHRSSQSGCRPGARRSTSRTTATPSPSRSADAGRVESRRLRDPQGQGFTLRGGGFVSGLGMEEVDLAPSGSRWTDPDLRQFDNEIRCPRRIQLEWLIPRIVPHTTPFVWH